MLRECCWLLLPVRRFCLEPGGLHQCDQYALQACSRPVRGRCCAGARNGLAGCGTRRCHECPRDSEGDQGNAQPSPRDARRGKAIKGLRDPRESCQATRTTCCIAAAAVRCTGVGCRLRIAQRRSGIGRYRCDRHHDSVSEKQCNQGGGPAGGRCGNRSGSKSQGRTATGGELYRAGGTDVREALWRLPYRWKKRRISDGVVRGSDAVGHGAARRWHFQPCGGCDPNRRHAARRWQSDSG